MPDGAIEYHLCYVSLLYFHCAEGTLESKRRFFLGIPHEGQRLNDDLGFWNLSSEVILSL